MTTSRGVKAYIRAMTEIISLARIIGINNITESHLKGIKAISGASMSIVKEAFEKYKKGRWDKS